MKDLSRTKLVVVLGGLVFAGACAQAQATENASPQPAAGAAQPATGAPQSNFMGGTIEVLDNARMGDVSALRLRFPAGVRSNWHTHTDGQLLMVESGHGLTQVRGGPIELKGPGEPWWTPAGVEHWHGAAPNEDVVQWTFYSGSVDWMDPVMDDQYHLP